MILRTAPFLVILVTSPTRMSFGADTAQSLPAITCDRTGGLYIRGEHATFTATGGAGQLSMKVTDYYQQDVISRQQAARDKPVSIPVDTEQLPRLGWHKITVTAGGASASTTFAVLPPARNLIPAEESSFGAIVSSRIRADRVADFARSLKLAGVRWADIDIPLAQINPKHGLYIWVATEHARTPQSFDMLVRALHKEGTCLMLKFLGQADWISRRQDKDVHAYWDSQLNLSPPSEAKKWTEVVAAVVKRYGKMCHTWEIGNEPEGHGYFKGTDDEYMEYLQTTARAIRSVQPDATIVAASMYHGGGVLPRLVKRPDVFDIMSVHYLTGPAGSISPLSHYQKALSSAGVKKVIWNTESRGSGGHEPPKPGETSHYRTDGARNQSPTKAYVRNFALGIPKVFVFSWNIGEGRQVVNPDLSPRWATVEYRTMADQLEGAKLVREVNFSNNLSAFHFQRAYDNILVAWSDVANYESVIELTAKPSPLVTDIMGNSTQVPILDDAASVHVSYQPVFIHSLDADFDVKRQNHFGQKEP